MEMITLIFIRKLIERNFQVELLCLEESRMQIEANNLGLIIHPVKAPGYVHPITILKIATLIKKNNYPKKNKIYLNLSRLKNLICM